MKSITELNGFIYLKGFDIDFSWCENTWNENMQQSVSYFPLNRVTRECFKREVLPIIKRDSDVIISTELFNKIKDFKQNEEIINTIKYTKMPQGITLKPHQVTALDYMRRFKRFGFFLGPGTGKTLIAITWLINAKPESCLIVTPLKVVGQYREELNKYMPKNTYEVVNYEQLHKYLDKTYEAVILDESHLAKNYSSNINFLCRSIAKKATYVYLFTGTPQDKLRHDILSQIAILDNRVIPENGKTKTFQRYFQIDDYYKPSRERREFSQELSEIINDYTWGKKSEEAITLTMENNFIIDCDEPCTAYTTLLTDRCLIKGDWTCVADNKGTLRIALRELCDGAVTMTHKTLKKTVSFGTSPKIKKLKELLSILDSGIIYYEFDESIPKITRCLQKENKSFVIVNGKTSGKLTIEYINQFKNGIVNFIVMQSKCGNAGLDFIVTNNVIFYSLPESYIVYHQCKSRIRRFGQTKECNYYHLLCKNSIEHLIYHSLQKKKSFTDRVFAQYL